MPAEPDPDVQRRGLEDLRAQLVDVDNRLRNARKSAAEVFGADVDEIDEFELSALDDAHERVAWFLHAVVDGKLKQIDPAEESS